MTPTIELFDQFVLQQKETLSLICNKNKPMTMGREFKY
jgi:hypothetical protein